MNAFMNLTIRASNQASRQIDQVRRDIRNAEEAAKSFGGRVGEAFQPRGLEKFGKDLQWTGRQLEYRFTLPIIAAGAAAGKWALENEKAMTSVRKVYGDLGMAESQVIAETEALGRAFRSLSDIFGVQQSQVIEIAAGWAAAGSAGAALAHQTRATLEAMILGDMGHDKAISSLITLQGQYKLSARELREELAKLNVIENETDVGFSDLIDSLTRAGGVARAAGVDVRELAAMTAALVPEAGTAANAGNGLKTIISRLLSPTKDVTNAIREMGIETTSTNWINSTATERLETLAKRYQDLNPAQQAATSSMIAGRYQVSRFQVLMDDMASSTGDYAKAMEAASDPTRNMATYTRELGIYLSSQPQAFQIAKTQLQNMAAEVMVPLLPVILNLFGAVAALVRKFTELSPEMQKLTLIGVIALAAVGPIASYIGSVAMLIGFLMRLGKTIGVLVGPIAVAGKAIALAIIAPIKLIPTWIGLQLLAAKGVILGGLATIGGAIGGVFSGIAGAVTGAFSALGSSVVGALSGLSATGVGLIVAAVTAAVAAIWIFRDQIFEFFGDIARAVIDGLRSLPETVIEIFRAVVRIIRIAAQEAYEWLSYLNPFVRHSPSLVESVSRGVDAIAAKYGSLRNVGSFFRGAIADLEAFKAATSRLEGLNRLAELNDLRVTIAIQAPEAVDEFDQLVTTQTELRHALALVSAEYAKQERIVARWEAALESANDAVDAQQAKLDSLRRTADEAGAALDAAKGRLSDLGDVQPAGLRAAEDAIFANEMAQKRLRLEIMRMEDAGHTLDGYKDRLAAINGELELVAGEQERFRELGAGSEVLKPFQDREAALRAEADQLQENSSEIQRLTDELEKLNRTGERLDLEKSLKFDPMLRELDQVRNKINEMPFEQLKAATIAQQNEVDRLQVAYDRATGAVERQQAAVDSAISRRDAIQESYDREKEKLDALGEAYDAIESKLNEVTSAMEQFGATAERAHDRALGRGGSGAGGAGGDALPFGVESPEQRLRRIDRERKAAEKAAEDAAKGPKLSAGMENLVAAAGAEGFEMPTGSEMFDHEGGLDEINRLADEWAAEAEGIFADADIFKPIREKWDQFKDWLAGKWDTFWRGLSAVGRFFKRAPGEIADFFKKVPGLVASALSGLGETIWDAVSGGLEWVRARLAAWWFKFTDWFGDTEIGKAIGRAFSKVTDELKRWEPIWNGVKDVLGGVWEAIKNMLPSWETIRDILGAIGGFLLDMLPSWDTVKGVIGTVGDVILRVAGFLGTAFSKAWELLEPVLRVVGIVFGAVFKGIETVVVIAIEAVGEVISRVLGVARETIERVAWVVNEILAPAFDGIRTVAEDVWGVVSGAVSDAWDVIEPIWDDIHEWIVESFLPALGDLKELFEEVWDKISDEVSDTWNVIEPILNRIKEEVEDGIGGAIKTAGDIWSDAWSVISWAVGVAWAIIEPIWDTIVTVLEVTIGGAVKGLKAVFEKAWEGITWAVGVAWALIEPIWNAIKDMLEVGIGVPLKLLGGTAKVVWEIITWHIAVAWAIIEPILVAFRDYLAGPLLKALGLVKDKAVEAWGTMASAINRAWDATIGPKVEQIAGQIKRVLIRAWEDLKEKVTMAWQQMKDWISGRVDDIVNKLTQIRDGAINLLGNAWERLRDRVIMAWQQAKDWISDRVDEITAIFTTLREQTIDKVIVAFDTMRDRIRAAIAQVRQVIADAWAWINERFNFIRNLIDTVLLPAFDRIKERFQIAWDSVKLKAAEAWGFVKGIWEGAMAWIDQHLLTKFTQIKDWFVGTQQSMASTIAGIWDQIIGKVSGAVNQVLGIINTIIRGIKSVASKIGINLPIGEIPLIGEGQKTKAGVPKIPLLASGGYPLAMDPRGGLVNHPRAIVGEGNTSHPEVVIATDPKHRQPNLRYWAKAGQLLGVPGFASGGIPPGPYTHGLYAPLGPVVERIMQEGRGQITISSGWRSNESQRRLRAQHGYTSDSQPAGAGGRLPVARPGSSKHEQGLAVDFGGNRSLYTRLAQQYGLRATVSGEPWHWEHASGGIHRPGLGDYARAGGEYVMSRVATEAWNLAKGPINAAIDRLPHGANLGGLSQALLRHLVEKVGEWASRQDDQLAGTEHSGYSGPVPGGPAVERWRSTFLEALRLANAPPSWINSGLRRLKQESGGNPNAINNWDSNARKGTPSKGLMQVIDPTFDAYAKQLRPKGVWDPLANIFASINYANARYGSAPKGWDRAGGYARGSWEIMADKLAMIHKGEMIIPAHVAERIRQATDRIATAKARVNQVYNRIDEMVNLRASGAGKVTVTADGAGGNTYHVNIDKVEFPNIKDGNDVDDFLDQLADLVGKKTS